ncbi:MAG: elongation factor 1-beta [Candidatus Diapherotrites archaeon]|nr:elongation factor 1-beta [Candidatus Diapherotrites archaeon]
MAELAVTYKIVSDGPELFDSVLENYKSALPSDVKVYNEKVEELAFGLKAIVVELVVPEVEGKADEIEEKLKAVEGVDLVEVIDICRR